VTDAATVALARGGDKRAIARLVTVFEDERAAAAARRAAILALLADRRPGRVVGLTGAPGVGKSTLVGALATALVAGGEPRVAVVAVDPSSPLTGGALLGDRTRVRFASDDERLYFRSQASGALAGGVARATHQVCRLLARLFSTVIVETVGVGQGEIEIVRIADTTWLVVQPHGGDAVQFLKAGLMEVPDGFVISKGDLGAAAGATAAALTSSLRLDATGNAPRPVLVTSAVTGAGVSALAAAILAGPRGGLDDKAPYFFERWVADEHGRAGLRRLATLAPSTAAYLAAHGGLDGAQQAFIAIA
jgi:LAO/AO transport system kinase